MTVEDFTQLMVQVTDRIKSRALDGTLEAYLNDAVPADGDLFTAIKAACLDAIDEGWMCAREAGGIAYGRVIKPNAGLGTFSVDVVRMTDLKGPHHAHPNGEIDMVMPITETARFDDHGQGWCVYGPGSAHYPTVTGGEALVLYLLPDGAIAFTGQ